MTDNIARILANAKKVFKTKDNNLKYVVIANDENGKEIDYTLNFNCDCITVEKITTNGIIISNVYKYDRYVFFSVLKNFNTLIGCNITIYYNNINLTLDNIPAIVFNNLVYKKEGYSDDEKEHIKGEYADYFIAYNNNNNLINRNNYFTFLKFATEVEYFQIFTYLLLEYPDYVKNLDEEQIAILTYTSFKKDPSFSDRIVDLGFKFGFELLKLAVDNNDYEVLEHLYHNDNIDINAVKYGQTILDYAFGKNTDIEMVEHLIDHNIQILNSYCIIKYIKENPEIIESLFRRDDIIDILKIRNFNGWSVAHIIAKNENPEVVKLMMFRMKNIKNILNIKTGEGWSVAHIIAENKNPEVVKLLFEKKDIMDILKLRSYCNGWTVAHEMAKNRNPKIVKLLFEIKDIGNILYMRTHFIGRSVAHVIAKNEDPEIVKCLLERKDIDHILSIKDKNGYSVADALAGNKNPEAIEFLLTFKNIKLKNESINSIKENFGKKGKCGKNEKIMKLLNLYKLNKTTNLFEKKEEKTCTIC